MKPETQDRAPEIVIDQALLDRAKAKDREALGLLYEASSLEIYRSIHALVRDEDLTLDIQQDTYLQAFSHLDQLRDPERFLPWLRQIAVNQARAQLRRKRPTLFTELLPIEEGEEPEFPDLSPQASPELALDRKETTRLIREILDGLTDGQRLLVGMYYYEQLSMSEIAQELGLSVGTVKSQLHRGRKHVETEVRKLEAKGVKLYGLGPLPFLLALLHRAEPSAAQEKLLAAAASQSVAGTAPALETAAVHVGRGFFQTALGRVTLGLMAAAALGGGVLGYGRIKDKLLIGDYQPPTPVESDENLSTEPREDLTTEFILITETETTEATEAPTSATEPTTEAETQEDLIQAQTEPETQAADPSEATPKPTEPTTPTPTQPKPTTPVTTEPTTPDTQTAPTDASEKEVSEIVNVFWTNYDSAENLNYPWENPNTKGILCVVIRGDEVPSLYADPAQMLTFDFWGLNPTGRPPEEDHVYYWTVTVNDYGTANIYCKLNGISQRIKTITMERPEQKLVKYYWYERNRELTNPVAVEVASDEVVNLDAFFRGVDSSKIYTSLKTDNPDLIHFQVEGEGVTEDGLRGIKWSMLFGKEGAGTVWCEIDGERLFTIQITIVSP